MLAAIWILTCVLTQPVCPGQDSQSEQEAWPDGTPKVERQVIDLKGRTVPHGPYRSWFANGQLEQEGDYEGGWRSGAWKSYHENGVLAAEGAYDKGLRTARWRFWKEDGKADSDRQGTYRAEVEDYPSGGRRIGGEYKGKNRHGNWTYYSPEGTVVAAGEYSRDRRSGVWTFFWPADGSVRFRGEYLRGARNGIWTFYLPDGSEDLEILGGTFRKGKRVGRPEARSLPDIDLDSMPKPSPHPGNSVVAIMKLNSDVQSYCDGEKSESLGDSLLAKRRAAMPAILERLLSLDLTSQEDVALGHRLNYELLARMHKGSAYAWASGVEADDVRINALTIARWLAQWESTRHSREFVASLAERNVGGVPAPEFFELPYDPFLNDTAVANAALTLEPPFGLNPSARRRALSKYGGQGTEKALAAALDWLVVHQEKDGHWSASRFSKRCEESKAKSTCSGGGHPEHNAGVSSLALLALMGNGSGLQGGPHTEEVQRGIEWLAAQQNPKTGLIGSKVGHAYIYDHALATIALAKGLRSGGSAVLREQLGLARDFILSQQLESGGWRYGDPGDKAADGSVTPWIVHALVDLEECGVPVDSSVTQRALSWLEKMADGKTGRMGYINPGEGSARVPNANGHYERVCATLTGAALFARIHAGQTAEDYPLMNRQAQLILENPPRWQVDQADLYGWYHCTYGLYNYGGKAWKVWNEAMKESLLAAQVSDRKSHAFGSIKVQSAWAYSGGRVYSTALGALMLEVYISGAPLLD